VAVLNQQMTVDSFKEMGPNIIRMIKSRRIKCAGHVAFMGDMRNVCRILFGMP
jgi:hypothetical protein